MCFTSYHCRWRSPPVPCVVELFALFYRAAASLPFCDGGEAFGTVVLSLRLQENGTFLLPPAAACVGLLYIYA